jgi:hypothetical protein
MERRSISLLSSQHSRFLKAANQRSRNTQSVLRRWCSGRLAFKKARLPLAPALRHI